MSATKANARLREIQSSVPSPSTCNRNVSGDDMLFAICGGSVARNASRLGCVMRQSQMMWRYLSECISSHNAQTVARPVGQSIQICATVRQICSSFLFDGRVHTTAGVVDGCNCLKRLNVCSRFILSDRRLVSDAYIRDCMIRFQTAFGGNV